MSVIVDGFYNGLQEIFPGVTLPPPPPIPPSLLTINNPLDNGVSSRTVIESYLAVYGSATLPSGSVLVDRTPLMLQNGAGLAGVTTVPETSSGVPIPNVVESRIAAATTASGFSYTTVNPVTGQTNGALAVGSTASRTGVTITQGLTVIQDTNLRNTSTGGGQSDVGRQIISPAFPAGTYLLFVVDQQYGIANNGATANATTYTLGPSVFYSVIQKGDDNVSAANWVRYLTIDAGTICPVACFNATAYGWTQKCTFNGGTGWSFDSSAVGGNNPTTGSGPGVRHRMIDCDTDNAANYQFVSGSVNAGGAMRIQGGNCIIIGGNHARGRKNLHGSLLQVIGGYWSLDDNTAVKSQPHVDIFINVTFTAVTFSGIQTLAMFRRNTRGGSTAPVTVTFNECQFVLSGGGTANLLLITDLQPAMGQFDPIKFNGCEIMQFGQSSNSAGCSPVSALVDDPRATFVDGLLIDGGAVAQFSVATPTYGGTAGNTATAQDTSTNFAATAVVGALVTSGGGSTGLPQKSFIVTSVTTTTNPNDTLNGTGGWFNANGNTGAPASGPFYVSQLPNPTLSTLFGTVNPPAQTRGVVYQVTYPSVAVTITSASTSGNPTTIQTLGVVPGLVTGGTVYISGFTGGANVLNSPPGRVASSVTTINGGTVNYGSQFTVPVNNTTALAGNPVVATAAVNILMADTGQAQGEVTQQDSPATVASCVGTGTTTVTTGTANGFAGLCVGMTVTDQTTGTNIPASTTITKINSTTSIQLNNASGTFGADTLAFTATPGAPNHIVTTPILQPGTYQMSFSTSLYGATATVMTDVYIAPSATGGATIDRNWGTFARSVSSATGFLPFNWTGFVTVTVAGTVDLIMWPASGMSGATQIRGAQSVGGSGMSSRSLLSWRQVAPG